MRIANRKSQIANVLAAVVLTLAGCKRSGGPRVYAPVTNEVRSAREVTISGQVFIARADRETVKLSATPVVVGPEEEMLARLQEIRSGLGKVARARQEKIEAIQAELKREKDSDRASKLRMEQLLLETEVGVNADRALWEEEWSGPGWQQVLTDAEGRFEVRAREGEKLMVVAKAKRRIWDDWEYYFWAERIEGTNVILANESVWELEL